MSDSSDTRARAEQAFKTQTRSLERGRIVSEQELVEQARSEKTARLRALRLQKEASDASASEPTAKPKRTSRSRSR